eukprot:3109027-Prymnesium_polylepis.1
MAGARQRWSLPRVDRLRAVGHRQHQDVRRVARSGAVDGGRAPAAGLSRPRQPARAHPTRGAGPAAHRRRRHVL